MKRKIYNQLHEWKEMSNGTSAVMVEGARRIGKSYIVEEFARNEYDDYLLINFRLAPKEVKEYTAINSCVFFPNLDKCAIFAAVTNGSKTVNQEIRQNKRIVNHHNQSI